jgi:fluoride ion exporter CrcB/FEX
VLLVDVLGTVLLAAALVTARQRPERASLLVDGAGTGFCGGLTTFSSLAVGIAAQLRAGEVSWAILTTLTVVMAGIGAGVVTTRLLSSRSDR